MPVAEQLLEPRPDIPDVGVQDMDVDAGSEAFDQRPAIRI
jgi:hypothetical protein